MGKCEQDRLLSNLEPEMPLRNPPRNCGWYCRDTWGGGYVADRRHVRERYSRGREVSRPATQLARWRCPDQRHVILYLLNAEQGPERPDYAEDNPLFMQLFALRGVLDCRATDSGELPDVDLGACQSTR